VLTTPSGVRVLGPPDLPDFLALAAQDPVVNVFVDYRARTTQLDRRWLGGEVLGRFVDGELVSALHVGANLVPIQAGSEDLQAFADMLIPRRHHCATLVGLHKAVDELWVLLGEQLGRARETRWRQPHLEIGTDPAVAPDPGVRRTGQSDIDVLYPACVAMYTEEVGVSPEAGGGAPLYRARVAQLVSRGWSFARFDDTGRVIFKAEVACASPYAAQVQGVYVVPDLRGRGLASAGMAAVVEAVRRDIAPTVSLYVNEWNESARAAYARVGFVESARFSTVMF
jgi:predicted GNAT family acetyltransferase